MELRLAGHIAYATFLGAVIGWERNKSSDPHAGMATYAAVCLGACAFGLVSLHVGGSSDPTRLSAQVVSGIGFLGAGVILRDQGRITGLTTAATILGYRLGGSGHGLFHARAGQSHRLNSQSFSFS